MKYEIWMIVEDDFEFIPMIKEYESDNFTQTYCKYMELSKSGMYVIYQNQDKSFNRNEKLKTLGIV